MANINKRIFGGDIDRRIKLKLYQRQLASKSINPNDSWDVFYNQGINSLLLCAQSLQEIHLIAQKIIPKGYTASACVVKGVDEDGDARMRCFLTDLDGTSASPVSSNIAISSGAYTMPFSPLVIGDGEKIVTIFFNPGDTTDTIYGGKITIAKT